MLKHSVIQYLLYCVKKVGAAAVQCCLILSTLTAHNKLVLKIRWLLLYMKCRGKATIDCYWQLSLIL